MASPQFYVGIKRQDRVHRLKPAGELDIATVPVLADNFDAAFDDGDAAMIVVDLTELAFIDVTGLRLLFRMNELCAHADRLRLINGSPAVVRLIDITGVRDRLPIISSADDPLAPLSPPHTSA